MENAKWIAERTFLTHFITPMWDYSSLSEFTSSGRVYMDYETFFRPDAYHSDISNYLIVQKIPAKHEPRHDKTNKVSVRPAICLFEIRKIAVCFLWLSLPGDYRVTDEALLAETT